VSLRIGEHRDLKVWTILSNPEMEDEQGERKKMDISYIAEKSWRSFYPSKLMMSQLFSSQIVE